MFERIGFIIFGFLTPYILYVFGGSFLSKSLLSVQRFSNVLTDTFIVLIPVIGFAVLGFSFYNRYRRGIAYSGGYILGLLGMVLLALFWHPSGGF